MCGVFFFFTMDVATPREVVICARKYCIFTMHVSIARGAVIGARKKHYALLMPRQGSGVAAVFPTPVP